MKNLAWYWTAAWIARRIAFGLLGGIEVSGLTNIPKSGPVLIAPIHLSYLDPPLIGCVCNRPLRFMAKEELFKSWFLGWLIRSLGAFPIKRGAGDMAAMRKAIEWLQNGEAVIVFPEGHRGDGERLQPLLAGVAVMAHKTQAQIVPVGIFGTQIILPRGSNKVKRQRCKVVFGVPFSYHDVVKDSRSREDFLESLEEKLREVAAEAGLELNTSNSK